MCPQCKKKFALTVPQHPDDAPFVEALEDHQSEPASAERAASRSRTPQAGESAQGTRHRAPGGSVTAATVVSPKIAAPANVTVAPVEHAPVAAPRHDPVAARSLHTHADGPQDKAISGMLGGYEILQPLGQGGMGAVYLARQISLQRNVAVKVLHPQLAKDAQFISRFTREAYAAAQLVHHNVVQIHDIGAEKDTHFYSMEFVEGQTLGDVVQHSGKLDPEAAVGYVLQAARGLKFAHDQGMIHRDVKPENLLLNDQGIVKVTDLGLVKTAGSTDTGIARGGQHAGDGKAANLTQPQIVMGTPAYLPPEQITDAANVDARADIYSLGCTFYDLLTGRPPFEGRTAVEVMTKHTTQAIIPPDVVVKRVPKTLSAILMKMVAKKPQDRYQNMTEVIKALEEFLGIDGSGPFSPREEHVTALEESLRKFNAAAGLRYKLILGFFALCGLAILAAAMTARLSLAGGFVGYMLMTVAAYIVLTGITRKTHLFLKLRQMAFSSRIRDWFNALMAAGVFVVLLVILNQHLMWLGFSIAAALTAAGFHFSMDRLLAKQRGQPLDQTEQMLRTMRLRGLEEEALRHFVCKYSGKNWEEFYEAMFGYEAKIIARQKWGQERGQARKKHGVWRDGIIRWVDARQKHRQEEKERKHLQHVEAKSLEAQGVDQIQARRQAKKLADKMVHKAAVIKAAAAKGSQITLAPQSAVRAAPTFSARSLMDVENEKEAAPEEYRHESFLTRRFGGPFGLILGSQVRLILGVVLLLGFALWLNQNGMIPKGTDAKKLVENVIVQGQETTNIRAGLEKSVKTASQEMKTAVKGNRQPLKLAFIPKFITNFFYNFNPGVAGLALIISAFFAGSLIGFFSLGGAAVIMLGGSYLPSLLGLSPPIVALVLGMGIVLMGLILVRKAT